MGITTILYIVLIVFAAASNAWFWYLRTHEERTLRLGLAFMCSVLGVLALVECLLASVDADATYEAALLLAAACATALLVFPVLLVTVLILSGVRLIRREGARPANLLSLCLGILLVAYVLVWPWASEQLTGLPFLGRLLAFLFGIASIVIGVATVAFTCFTVTGLIVQVPHRRRTYSRIVVGGAGLADGRKVTPLLAGRVDAGIAACVMSGGQGPDEEVPEACAMRDYAMSQGVPAVAILTEEASRNTEENIANSAAIVGRDAASAGRALVVTDDYHVLRALLLARNLGFACDGCGSHVRLYFSLNALVREWVAYAVLRKQKYLRLLAWLCGIYTVGWVLLTLINVISA